MEMKTETLKISGELNSTFFISFLNIVKGYNNTPS